MYAPELLHISYTVIVSGKLMPNRDIISYTSEISVPIYITRARITNTSYKKYHKLFNHRVVALVAGKLRTSEVHLDNYN